MGTTNQPSEHQAGVPVDESPFDTSENNAGSRSSAMLDRLRKATVHSHVPRYARLQQGIGVGGSRRRRSSWLDSVTNEKPKTSWLHTDFLTLTPEDRSKRISQYFEQDKKHYLEFDTDRFSGSFSGGYPSHATQHGGEPGTLTMPEFPLDAHWGKRLPEEPTSPIEEGTPEHNRGPGQASFGVMVLSLVLMIAVSAVTISLFLYFFNKNFVQPTNPTEINISMVTVEAALKPFRNQLVKDYSDYISGQTLVGLVQSQDPKPLQKNLQRAVADIVHSPEVQAAPIEKQKEFLQLAHYYGALQAKLLATKEHHFVSNVVEHGAVRLGSSNIIAVQENSIAKVDLYLLKGQTARILVNPCSPEGNELGDSPTPQDSELVDSHTPQGNELGSPNQDSHALSNNDIAGSKDSHATSIPQDVGSVPILPADVDGSGDKQVSGGSFLDDVDGAGNKEVPGSSIPVTKIAAPVLPAGDSTGEKTAPALLEQDPYIVLHDIHSKVIAANDDYSIAHGVKAALEYTAPKDQVIKVFVGNIHLRDALFRVEIK